MEKIKKDRGKAGGIILQLQLTLQRFPIKARTPAGLAFGGIKNMNIQKKFKLKNYGE